jgi:hypothetical protein
MTERRKETKLYRQQICDIVRSAKLFWKTKNESQ